MNSRMLEQSMKDTCKSWLQVLTACLSLSATGWGQVPELVDVPGSKFAELDEDYGAVRLGGQDLSASAVVSPDPIPPGPQPVMAPPMFQDAMIPADDSVGFAVTRVEDQVMFRVGRTNLDQFGIDGGYTNVNAFIPAMFNSDRSLWWINPRVNITDDSDSAVNLGAGYRVYIPEDDRVYGASFWWDYDGGHNTSFNALGGSFESLGRFMDLRANFSLPVGQMSSSSFTGFGPARLVGSEISSQRFQLIEEAMQVYDAEVAIPAPILGPYGFEVGAGFYYLGGSETQNAPGVSLRAQSQINSSFWINGLYTYDDTFGGNFSLNFELTSPAARPLGWFRERPVAASLTDSVIRRYRIPVTTSTMVSSVSLTNPKDGEALQIAHVDPNKATAGDGTVENPFNSIQMFNDLGATDKAVFDIVYVRPRADDTDTNLNTGVDLLGCQRLLSTSVVHAINSLEGTFTLGLFDPTMPLPKLTTSGVTTDRPVVSLETGGMGFEVSGFDISHEMTLAGPNATVGSAIHGMSVSDVSITRNVLRDSEYGTLLEDFSGSLHYRENVIRDNTVGGMQVEYTGDGQLALFSNYATNNLNAGFEVIADGVSIEANNLDVPLPTAPDPDDPSFPSPIPFGTLTGSTSSDPNVFPFDPVLMAKGIANNVADMNETGMILQAINGGSIEANVEGNTFSNNQSTFTGGFLATADGAGSSITFETFSENIAEDNVGTGVQFSALNGGQIITPLQIDPSDPLNMNMIPGFTNNSFNNNLRNGFALVVDNSELNDFAMSNITAQGNRESGVALYLQDATFGGWVIEDSVFTENGEDGLTLVMFNTTGTDLTIRDSQLNDNGGNGYNVIAEDSVLTDLILESNEFNGNGNNALGSLFNITLAFNTQTGMPGLFAGNPLTALTPAEQAIFQSAARRWEELIVGDLTDVNDPMFQPTFGTIDDVLLLVDGENYNGTGVLGVSYGLPSMLRPADGLPFWGMLTMTNDGTVNVQTPNGATDYFSIALHEIGHSLGFRGSTFGAVETATGANIWDPATDNFLGATAVAAHNAAFGVNATQIQLSPGSGHWGDPLYANEFMFPSIVLGQGIIKPQSRMTVGLMQDLGYVVNLNAADTYPLTAAPVSNGGVNDGHVHDIDLTPGSYTLPDFDQLVAAGMAIDGAFDVAQSNEDGQNGIQIVLTDSEISNVQMTDNFLDGNGQDGLRAELRGASILNLTSSRDTYATNDDHGVEIITRDTSTANVDFQNATIINNTLNGFLGTTFDNSVLNASFTSPDDPLFTGTISTISGNGMNGIRIVGGSTAPSTNNSMVTLLVDDVLFDSNGLRGIDVLSRESSVFDISILNSVFMDNGTDGVGLERDHDGHIDGIIENNMFLTNGGNGIELISRFANTIDTYFIHDNIIRGNGDNGIHLRTEADAIIDSTINWNLIENNVNNGIHVTDRANSALDQRNVSGLWTQNDILNNGGSGIQLDGSYGFDPILQIGQNGTDADGVSLGNVIDGNGRWGIQSTAVGIANIDNNLITDNGLGGINIASSIAFGNIIGIDNNFIGQNGGTGIELLAENNVFQQVDISNNTITENAGDGIETATLDVASSFITIDTNLIFINGRRGIDVLNAGASPDAFVSILNTTVNANGEEGVYVVNSADVNEFNFKDGPAPDTNPFTDPTHGMQANGNVFNDPQLRFIMDNTSITNNGISSQFDATGFVMRVGTSDASASPFFDGGLASNGFGGVIADVTNNNFSGNFGTDVWFESFVSTAPPQQTLGTWSATDFDITGPNPYEGDPLARLDLVFTGNTGNSIDVTNLGAWYDNPEPVFKSRLFTATPPGPFGSATRMRNAQRLASRVGLPPIGGPGAAFQYPGMGTSTFRVGAGTTIGFIGSGADNEFQVIGSTFNTLVGMPAPTLFGELPFGWDTTTFIP